MKREIPMIAGVLNLLVAVVMLLFGTLAWWAHQKISSQKVGWETSPEKVEQVIQNVEKSHPAAAEFMRAQEKVIKNSWRTVKGASSLMLFVFFAMALIGIANGITLIWLHRIQQKGTSV